MISLLIQGVDVHYVVVRTEPYKVSGGLVSTHQFLHFKFEVQIPAVQRSVLACDGDSCWSFSPLLSFLIFEAPVLLLGPGRLMFSNDGCFLG